jgi:hypothetical protein
MDRFSYKVLTECFDDLQPKKKVTDPLFRGCNKDGKKCSLKDWKRDSPYDNKVKSSLEQAEQILQKENPSSGALKLIREVLASGV